MTHNIETYYQEHGPVPCEKDFFKEVWKNQLELMKLYKEAGRLNTWPLELKPKANQEIIRELFGFLEEEMMEASQEVDLLYLAMGRNELTEAREITIKLNEEIADTLHFFIELFIFVGAEPIDFDNIYKGLALEQYLNSEKGEVLKLAFQYSENYMVKKGKLPLDTSILFSQAGNLPDPYAFAGHRISSQVIDIYEKATFYTIQKLHLAKNCLKNKYWKAKEYDVDIIMFNNHLVGAWLQWINSLMILGIRAAPLAQTYLLKNRINIEKIKTH